jgi:hypothetical protein
MNSSINEQKEIKGEQSASQKILFYLKIFHKNTMKDM